MIFREGCTIGAALCPYSAKGSVFMSMKKCTNCGADLDPAAKFCMDCGMEQTPETSAQPVSEPQTADISGDPDGLPDAGHIPDYSMNSGGYKVEDGGNGGASALFVVMILSVLLMASVVIWAVFAILANVPDRQKSSDKFREPADDYSYRDDREYSDDSEVYGGSEDFDSGLDLGEPEPDSEGYYPEGTYQIGVDIPEGIYFLRGEVYTDGYGTLTSDARYDIDSDSGSDGGWFQFCRYVELRGHGSIDLISCDAYDISAADVHGDPFEHPGMFIVGRDLDAGTYRLADTSPYGNGMAYAVYDSLDEVHGDSIFDVGNFDAKDGDEITLTDGQIIEMQWCVLADIENE